MDSCVECKAEFTNRGIRTGLQNVPDKHSRAWKLQDLLYCPNCCVAYQLDGKIAENENGPMYFDKDYTCLKDGVFQWGRLVADKGDMTNPSSIDMTYYKGFVLYS